MLVKAMMNELSPHKVAELAWGDAWFSGFRWLDEQAPDSPPALLLYLRPSLFPESIVKCEWVRDFVSDLDYRDLSGSVPAWDVEFAELPSGGWRIAVDLRPRGRLSLECGSFSLLPAA
ncbi:MAG: hypothetical protein KDB27_10620 [Planctomycetales bacterium]|nr:hypothetical protein [Planctomycetales bacterium]